MLTSSQKKDYSMSWVVDKEGIFVEHYVCKMDIQLELGHLGYLALVDWTEYLCTVCSGSSFEKFNYDDTIPFLHFLTILPAPLRGPIWK